jgi:hypothetical protein
MVFEMPVCCRVARRVRYTMTPADRQLVTYNLIFGVILDGYLQMTT